MKRNDILQTIELMRRGDLPFEDTDPELLAYREEALCDILSRITDRPQDDPEDILYWFMVEMEGYSELQRHKRVNMFDVAMDTADIVFAMCEHPTDI